MKKLIIALSLLGSVANAGLCIDQIESCLKALQSDCKLIKVKKNSAIERGVTNLCLVGSGVVCYKQTISVLGEETCLREFRQEQEERENPAPSPSHEAKENGSNLNK